MHYKNGKPAKVGDIVVTKDYSGVPYTGVVVQTNTQSNTCNLVVAPIRSDRFHVTASETLHADDVFKDEERIAVRAVTDADPLVSAAPAATAKE